MLQTLDVLIGFTLVMLIMSMAVTMLTQLFGTWLLNLKGKALREVITRLLSLLDRGLKVEDARAIADHILRDPLIAQPNLSGSQSLATVVHREELVKLILDFASNGDASKASQQANDDSAKAPIERLQHVMRESLERNGIADPASVLEAIRSATLELEKTSPELASGVRAAAAILNHAASDFLAKVNSWFDQTIDRAIDLFTVRIRMVTVGASLVVAFLFQLNTFELINRLSVDDELRNELVAEAIERSKTGPPQDQAAGAGQAQTIEEVIENSGVHELEEVGLIAFPQSTEQWTKPWREEGRLIHLIGIIFSAALLSLGAPFWYSLMANLVKLRSVIAGKDDLERAERQTSQAGPTIAKSLPPAYRGGEAGDLTATG